jgi:hypothetical protein
MSGEDKSWFEKVYRGQSSCMMCRKSSGERDFTQDEKKALFAEEELRKIIEG